MTGEEMLAWSGELRTLAPIPCTVTTSPSRSRN